MTAPFDQDDDPTARFVPSWGDDDDEDDQRSTVIDGADRADLGDASREEARAGIVEPDEASGQTLPEDAEILLEAPEALPEEPEVLPEVLPETPGAIPAGPEAIPSAPEAIAGEPADGVERPEVLPAEPGAFEEEPAAGDAAVVDVPADHSDRTGLVAASEAERRPRAAPAAGAGSATRRLWNGMRAGAGLLVLVVIAGVGLAAAIGLVMFGIAFALQQAVGG